ncbi:MAG: YbaK/EbsC family protein [Spirochaetales bacterium]|nr:YbaK/EbsC family protein [Spirochaetales bacterium]MCF7939437.1 YbaK/EbsC family protein [Spirochaetales bacterium]
MIPEKVQLILDQYSLEAAEFEPGSTPTSPTAAEKLGCRVGQIAKSMVFKGKDGRFFLIMAAGDRRISSKRMKELTGVKTRMANAEETAAITGFRPGGVCPFGLDGVEGLELFIDESLSEWETVYPAAGTDASGVPVSYERLKEITGAAACNVTEVPS